MLTIILIVVLILVALALVGVSLAMLIQRRGFKETIANLEEMRISEYNSYLQVQEAHFEQIDSLEQCLDDSYRCLEAALVANPGQFNGVATELGLHGVVYRFYQKELKENHAGSSHDEQHRRAEGHQASKA